MKALQTMQLRAARLVTGHDRYAPTKEILLHCDWLSVRQLAAYHTLLLIRSIVRNKSPRYLYEMFNTDYNYNTRQATSGKIKLCRNPELQIAKSGFGFRAMELFNSLPEEIRNVASPDTFKRQAKDWVKKTVRI